MRLHEHEAKRILEAAGVAVPYRVYVGGSLAEIRALRPQFPVVVKAQVLAGGRGKAGGIVRAETAKETIAAAKRLLGSEIAGFKVETVLIEQAIDHSAACYLGAALNPASTRTLLMGSAAGGVEIETLAKKRPDAIVRVELDPLEVPGPHLDSPPAHVARFLANELGAGTIPDRFEVLANSLLDVYRQRDCTLLEINPLFVTANGLVAADAKMVLDGNALYRQREFLASLGIEVRRHATAESTGREDRAVSDGFTYVDLLPENARRQLGKVYVGLAPGGAGYGILSIDEVVHIGAKVRKDVFVPLNFMDSGGGPSRKAVKAMFSLLLDHPLVDLVITSRFGGISSCDIFIRGLVECLRERIRGHQRIVPIYGRMVGTDLAAARQFLRAAQQESPDALAQLHMQTGNESIMADVIRDALADFIARNAA